MKLMIPRETKFETFHTFQNPKSMLKCYSNYGSSWDITS